MEDAEKVQLPKDEERFCPYFQAPCKKEYCLKYYPTQIIEMKLGMPVPKNTYMCLDLAMIGVLQSISNSMVAFVAGQMQRSGGIIPPGGLGKIS